MLSHTEEPRANFYRTTRVVLVVLLSILVPLAIAGWWIAPFLSGKPWGIRINEFKNFSYGSVKNGELWFVSAPFLPYKAEALCDFRLKRLNLTSGTEQNTEIAVRALYCTPFWIKDDLYLVTDKGIYKTDGESILGEPLPLPARKTSITSEWVFSYDDRLTTLVEPNPGEFRLAQIVEGNWISGRQIRFPRQDRTWYHNVQRDRTELVPRTSAQPELSALRIKHASLPHVQVLQQGEQTHLLLSVYPDFSAYRNGFEFVDEDMIAPSALAPENDLYEVSGWEAIPTVDNEQHIFDQMQCDKNGLLFLAWGKKAHCARRHLDGQWEIINIQNKEFGHLRANSSESTAYLIHNRPWYDTWGNGSVRRIECNQIQPVHMRWSGAITDYLARWTNLRFGLIIAWLVHLGILFAGSACITGDVASATWIFGTQRAYLAPVWRRSLALFIDLAVGLAVISIVLWMFVAWVPIDIEEQCEALRDLEVNPAAVLLKSGFSFLPKPVNQATLMTSILTTVCILLGLRVFRESRFGTTIGKRLAGIRTVRTTLRPCGLSRALVRTVMLWGDLMGLITPLPAAISAMLSDQRQRLGDRIADTIVILAGSNQPYEPERSADHTFDQILTLNS